ncbi:MAG: hypothetical protein ACYTG6_07845 [Planctomycetota bacterium]|jgi:hypothetical protein
MRSPFRPTRLPLRWAALGLLLGTAAFLPAASAAENPTVYYRDPVHKFSFKIFPKWEQVPLEAGSTTTVAKFMEGGAGRGGWFDPDLVVVRIEKEEGAGEPVLTGEGEDPLEAWRRANRPKTAWDATVGRLAVPDDRKPDPDDFDEIESKDDVEGKIWVFEVEYGSGRDATLFCTLVSFEKEGVEYGLFMTCGKTQRRKYERGFRAVGKSFRFFDRKADDVESLDVLDGVNISARRRSEIERSMVRTWDVIVSPKKNYIILYNTKNNRNHALAKEIARRIEKIREQIYEVQFPPARPITAVSIVRVCKDRREYHAYGGPGGSAGYWNSADEELVFYDASPSQKIDDDTVSVLYHEAFHQYIYYSVGDVAPHSWFNEGHGDYYAGAEYRGGRFRIRPFAWRRGVIKNAVAQGPRQRTTQTDLETGEERVRFENDGGYTPLKDLVRFTQMEYYSYPSISYAQGWSLIYFLREVVPKDRKYREKWGHILDTYFEVLQREVNKEGELRPGGDPEEDGAPEEGGEDPAEEDADAPTTPGEGEDAEPPDDEGEEDDGGDEEDGEGEEEEEEGGYLPALTFGGRGSAEALQKAVEEAFAGIDWEEFEEAWAKAVKKKM